MTTQPTGRITSKRGFNGKSWEAKRVLAAEVLGLNFPDGVKAIPLTRGLYVLVDEADYEHLMQWNWYAKSGDSKYFYASRSVKVSDGNGGWKQGIIGMHNVIMNPPEGMEVDHISCDTLDNRRSNLRVCTHHQNMANIRGQTNCTSRHKGVSWHKHRQKWQATIKINFKAIHLGLFDNPDEAAIAYNEAAKGYHGEYARLNQVGAI